MHNLGRAGFLAALCASALWLSSTSASAAGLLLPENGTDILGRGGAAVGFLDTAYALQFNPAGMTLGDGLDVRLDLRLAHAGETFQPAGQSVVASNTGGPSVGPEVMITYHPGSRIARMFAFGLGIWAPPGILNYQFPDPKNFSEAQAAAATPQRYNLISQGNIVLYPTIGLAFSPIKFFSIGADLQYVYANTQLTEDLEGLPSQFTATPNKAPNDVQDDVRASVNVTGIPRLSGIFGLIARPLGDLVPGNDLILSASYRPVQPLTENGTLNVTLGSDVTSAIPGVAVRPDPAAATLQLKLPPILRVGANFKHQRFAVSVEWVYEQWEVNNNFLLTTNGQLCGSSTGTCKSPLPGKSSATLPPVEIVNDWRNSSSIRGGFGYDFFRPREDGFLLQGNVGALYESNAIPYETQSLPFVTGNQLGISAGATFAWHGLGIGASFMYYAPQSFTVSNSVVTRGAPIPDFVTTYIGNGAYTTGYWVLSVGLSYHLGTS